MVSLTGSGNALLVSKAEEDYETTHCRLSVLVGMLSRLEAQEEEEIQVKVPFTKSGKKIGGTLEKLEGVCFVAVPSHADPTDHTTWEFGDHTEIFWDGQRTATNNEYGPGQVVFLDEDGEEVLESEVVWQEVGDDY